MSNLRVTELDFDDIKQNLKNYLLNYRDSDNNLIFADFDFDSSSISILLDILSYNTHYNAYLASMVANEMFLDSAIKRESAVSIAKHLGYTPLSFRSSRARVSFTVVPSGDPSSVTLPRYSPFVTNIEGTEYTFVNLDPVTILPQAGQYIFNNVEIVEGEPLEYTFRVDVSGPSEKYVIPNKNIDTTTIRVTVQNSFTDITRTTYTLAEDIGSINSESKVFFLEENPTGFFELFFGDNVLGKKLSPGNLVTVEYLVSSGSQCNVSKEINQFFTLGASVGGTIIDFPIQAVTNSTGGDEPDTIDEIKFKAPKFRSSMNRAVTADDYKAIIEANYPLVESVSIWGGEDNDPPMYGKVMISLKPYLGFTISDSLKERIRKDILDKRKMLTIIPEFVDPNYLYINLNTTVRHNTRNSKFIPQEIQSLVRGEINKYFSQELQKFDKDFVYSRLSKVIDAVDTFVIGNISSMLLQKRISPIPNSNQGYSSKDTIKFVNKIISGSVTSTTFFYEKDGEIKTVFMKDMLTSSDRGTLSLLDTFTGIIVEENLGTVIYSTGEVIIPRLNISGYVGETNDIRIYGKTDNLDINASKDVILVIDDSTGNTAIRRLSGLTINVISE